MKLIDNIAGFNAIAGAVLSVGQYRKTIDAAREAGDFEKEREEMQNLLASENSKMATTMVDEPEMIDDVVIEIEKKL